MAPVGRLILRRALGDHLVGLEGCAVLHRPGDDGDNAITERGRGRPGVDDLDRRPAAGAVGLITDGKCHGIGLLVPRSLDDGAAHLDALTNERCVSHDLRNRRGLSALLLADQEDGADDHEQNHSGHTDEAPFCALVQLRSLLRNRDPAGPHALQESEPGCSSGTSALRFACRLPEHTDSSTTSATHATRTGARMSRNALRKTHALSGRFGAKQVPNGVCEECFPEATFTRPSEATARRVENRRGPEVPGSARASVPRWRRRAQPWSPR